MGEKEEQKDDKPAEPQPSTVVLRVKMHCQGCERKVRKSLAKLDGLSELKIDRAEEKVIVKGFVDPKNVLKKVLKTGKPAEFWPAPAPPPPAKEEEAKKEEPKKEEKKVEEPKAEELKKEEPPKEEAPKKEEKKEEEPAKKEEPKKEESAKKEEPKKEEPKKEEEPAAKKGGEDKSEKETKGSEESVTLLNQPPMQFETVRIIAPQYFSDDNPNACSVM